MKRHLLQVVTCLALLSTSLPTDGYSAGGLKVGDTFRMKVLRVTSTKQTGVSGAPVANPVPGNLPRFGKNQVIAFRIRAGGKLAAPRGINIPFAHASGGVNEYNRFRSGTVAISHNAELTIRNRKAVSGNLNFFITDSSGAETVYYTVIYKLRRI